MMYLICCNSLLAQTSYIKDNRGKIVGSMSVSKEKITYRDSLGNVSATANIKSNSEILYRNSSGKIIGKAVSRNGKTFYYDERGRNMGSAIQSQGRIVYKDQKGRLTGFYDTQLRNHKGEPLGKKSKHPNVDYPIHMNKNKPRIR